MCLRKNKVTVIAKVAQEKKNKLNWHKCGNK